MDKQKVHNIVIIGGGPAGLAAAIYASRADLSPVVIEGVPPGGQLMLTTDVENYPGFPKGVLGPELISLFRAQAERFQTQFLTEKVTRITKENNIFRLATEVGTVVMTKAVLIAIGAEALWLNIPSEQRLRGKGVSACATCDGFFFRNKVVGVVGGGDTAMEEALTLAKFASKVYVIHRRETLRASKIMQERVLHHPKIEVVWNASVNEVLGETHVTGLDVTVSGAKKELTIDGLFLAIGHRPPTDFLNDSGVELDQKGYVYMSSRVALERIAGKDTSDTKYDFNYQYATSVPGIFVAGDCADHQYRQATTAIGAGVAAELEIERYLYSQEK